MSDEEKDLRRTIGDIEIARIRALSHTHGKRTDHRNYRDLPPGSGTTVYAGPRFWKRIIGWFRGE